MTFYSWWVKVCLSAAIGDKVQTAIEIGEQFWPRAGPMANGMSSRLQLQPS
jgi:hypothetical protein